MPRDRLAHLALLQPIIDDLDDDDGEDWPSDWPPDHRFLPPEDSPPGILSWDELFQVPRKFGPWPYSDVELEAIAARLPEDTAPAILDDVIFTARRFKRVLAFRNAKPAPGNPRREIERLAAALAETKEALQGLSPEAEEYLSRQKPLPFWGAWPEAARTAAMAKHTASAIGATLQSKQHLIWSVDRFRRDHRFALEVPPATSRGGAPRKAHEQWLLGTLRDIWKTAHTIRQPARGWSAFRDACAKPLLGVREEKSLQDKTAPRKRRKNPLKNR